MNKPSNRVIVIGAGPVGLCLSLALAQQGIPVCLIEALGDHNFLEQVPRAGTNHPATLELFERIGLYDKLEPRGIIAPLFHYWDRHESKLVAEFDHAHLKDDTRFPYVLQCERIKIVEEALKLVKAHPGIELRLSTEFTAFSQTADGVTAQVTNPAGKSEAIAGSYLVSAEGARSIVRKDLDIEFEGFTYPDRTLNIEVAYDFRQHGYTERNYISDPDEWSNLFHWKGPPDRWRVHFPTAPDADETALTQPDALQARLQRFLPIGKGFDIVGSNLYVGAPARGEKIPRRPRHPRRRLRAREQPDRRHGHEQRHSRRVQSGGEARRHPAREGGCGHSRPLRAPAPPRRVASTRRLRPCATSGC